MWTSYVLSHFSRVQLFANPWTIACQAPLSMEFSHQEYWSELLLFLQRIFPTQGSNLCLLHYEQIPYHWATRETWISYMHTYSPSFLSLPHCLTLKVITESRAHLLLITFWKLPPEYFSEPCQGIIPRKFLQKARLPLQWIRTVRDRIFTRQSEMEGVYTSPRKFQLRPRLLVAEQRLTSYRVVCQSSCKWSKNSDCCRANQQSEMPVIRFQLTHIPV